MFAYTERIMTRNTHAAMSVLLCLQLLAPGIPAAASDDASHCKKDCPDNDFKKTTGPVTLEVGQPSVWSLAQAHYLLTEMHKANRKLATQMPTMDQLDPNRANASRLDILRTLLQVDAGFDQSVALKNQVELQHFREKEQATAQAQIQVQQRQATLQQLDQDLLDLNQQIAVLTVQDGLSDKARGSAPPSEADRQRKEKIASLTVQRDAKVAQRTALQAEIDSLNKTATTDVATPTVNAGTPPTSTSAPGSTATAGGTDATALKDFATQALKSFTSSPSVAASAALDNFLGMQYEIIAKQLTLLRDEAGPDERIVFLELPASIYTVDRWANDMVAQVTWKVTDVYVKKPSAEAICQALDKEQDSPQAMFRALNSLPDAQSSTCVGNLTLNALGAALREEESDFALSDVDTKDDSRLVNDLTAKHAEATIKSLGLGKKDSTTLKYPITLDMIREEYDQTRCCHLPELDPSRSRALEIIPRQSALNINEYQATTNNTGFLGLLKLLSGFGAQVNVQKQKEVYQDFLQQDVYASGFGKGTAAFGWTFGPLPGSRRLAPGQRTTYAVLAVPRKALAVRISADAWAFPTKVQPEKQDLVRHRDFLVLIPSESTDRFWIKSVTYPPVSKGKPATVIVEGSDFSPQLGVLVNGVALKRVLSISRAESEEPEIAFSDTGVQGEFELANSRTLLLRFSMGKDFVGTPIITLVSPERSTAINSLPLQVNFRQQSLVEASTREPIFSDDLRLNTSLEPAAYKSIGYGTPYFDKIQTDLDGCTAAEGFGLYRITGDGLRPDAQITVNDVPLKIVTASELFRLLGALCPQQVPAARPRPARVGRGFPGAARAEGAEEAREAKNLQIVELKTNGSSSPPKTPVDQPRAIQETTHSYLLYFPVPESAPWVVRYRQPTRQGLEERRFEHVPPAAAEFKAEVRHYQFNPTAKSAR